MIKYFLLLLALFSIALAAQPKSESDCILCKLILVSAETYLATNKSETQVENFLDNTVCHLPYVKEYESTCVSFVNNNYPALVTYIIEKEPPSVACAQLGVCGNTTRPLTQLSHPVMPMMELKPVKGALECTICTTVINLAESILGSNASETAIEDFLENTVCTILPGSLKTDCDALVEAYLPALVQYIQEGESGAVACAQLGICSSTAAPPMMQLNHVQPVAEPQPVKGALECTICTTVINLAESILGSNASESAIENFLDNVVCTILPGSLKTDCDALVQAYLPALVQYIQEGESGAVACAQLGLCNSTEVRPMMQLNAVQPVSHQKPVKGALECTACTIIVTLAETFLGSNASESAIENFLENTVCTLVPDSFTAVCNTIVQQYTPQLVTYIQNSENPTVACTQVGLCNSTVALTQTVGRRHYN